MTTNKVGLDIISSWRELIPRTSFQVNGKLSVARVKDNGDSVWSDFSSEFQCETCLERLRLRAMRVFVVVPTSVPQTTKTQRWPDKLATA